MCSKLYADGELAATPYETDKVLRHRELCMGLNVLYAKKNHDYGDSFHRIICKVKQGITNRLICHSLLIAVRGENAGERLKTAELITQANAWHCHSFFNVDSIMTVLEIDDAQHEQEIAEQKTCDEGASDAD